VPYERKPSSPLSLGAHTCLSLRDNACLQLVAQPVSTLWARRCFRNRACSYRDLCSLQQVCSVAGRLLDSPRSVWRSKTQLRPTAARVRGETACVLAASAAPQTEQGGSAARDRPAARVNSGLISQQRRGAAPAQSNAKIALPWRVSDGGARACPSPQSPPAGRARQDAAHPGGGWSSTSRLALLVLRLGTDGALPLPRSDAASSSSAAAGPPHSPRFALGLSEQAKGRCPHYSLVRLRSQAAHASTTPSLACCSLASPGARNSRGHTRSTGACRPYGRPSGGRYTEWGRGARQRRRYQQREPHQGRRSASEPTRERCGPRHPYSYASRGPPLAGTLPGRPLEPGSHHIPGAAAPAWLCSASRLLCVHSVIHRRAPTEGCTRFDGLAAHAAGSGLAAGCGSTANTANTAFCTSALTKFGINARDPVTPWPCASTLHLAAASHVSRRAPCYMRRCLLWAALSAAALCLVRCQLSKPHAHDSQTDAASNKFLQRHATEDTDAGNFRCAESQMKNTVHFEPIIQVI